MPRAKQHGMQFELATDSLAKHEFMSKLVIYQRQIQQDVDHVALLANVTVIEAVLTNDEICSILHRAVNIDELLHILLVGEDVVPTDTLNRLVGRSIILHFLEQLLRYQPHSILRQIIHSLAAYVLPL